MTDQISDAEVEAARQVISDGVWFTVDKVVMRAALEAAAAARRAQPSAVSVDGVAALKWEDATKGPGCPVRFKAWPLPGYRIFLYQWGDADRWAVEFGSCAGQTLPIRGTADEAKATVQFNFNRYAAALNPKAPS